MTFATPFLPLAAVTPPTNRGVTVTTLDIPPLCSVGWVGFHWLTGTCRRSHREVLAILSDLLQAEPILINKGGMTYGCSAAFPVGVRVYWSPDRADVCVSVPGAACDQLSPREIMTIVVALGLRASRVDVAWDVAGMDVIGFLQGALCAGHVVTRAHRDSIQAMANRKGRTIYIGSRTSKRMLRCYDARGVTRLELECKEERAVSLLEHLCAFDVSEWSAQAFGVLRDYVDFRDRDASKRVSDCPLLGWWAAIVGGAERVRLPLPRVMPDARRSVRWLRRGVAPMLAAVLAGVPARDRAATIGKLLEEGRERWASRHLLVSALVAHDFAHNNPHL